MDVDTTRLAAMAMRHWERWLPQKTIELKEAGTFEMRANQAAKRAQDEIIQLVLSGMQLHQAEEIVLPEYILLPPEHRAK